VTPGPRARPGSTVAGLPNLAGFTKTFSMAALAMLCCVGAGLLIPVGNSAALQAAAVADLS